MRSSLSILCIAYLCHLAAAITARSGHPILQPVSDDDWGNSVRRRSVEDSLRLLDYEHMVWSSAPESRDNIFVNMTMFTGEEELIISMERFAPQLRAVSCNQNMMMSFNSNSSYQSAIQSWNWVNFNDQRTFIMIANYPGCGADNSREPWVVSNVDYDPTHLIVHLNATKKEWTDVAHTYNLDFGQYGPTAPSLATRMDFDKQINLDLTAALPVSFTFAVDLTPDLGVGVTCSNCGTKGTLTLAGHVETSWWEVKVFTVNANPTGVEMDLNLGISVSAIDPELSFKPPSWDFFTLPLGGFEIPGLCTLGPELTLGAGFAVTGVKGTATISSKVSGKIPDSSTAVINIFGDNKGATYSGWVPVWSAGPMDVSEKISSSIEVFGNAKVGVVLKVLGTGVELAFDLKIPDIALTAAFTHDDHGVCGETDHTDSVSLGLSIGADLSLKGTTDLLWSESTFLDVPIFHAGIAFGPPPACFGFGPAVATSSHSALATSSYSTVTVVSHAAAITSPQSAAVTNPSSPLATLSQSLAAASSQTAAATTWSSAATAISNSTMTRSYNHTTSKSSNPTLTTSWNSTTTMTTSSNPELTTSWNSTMTTPPNYTVPASSESTEPTSLQSTAAASSSPAAGTGWNSTVATSWNSTAAMRAHQRSSHPSKIR